MAKVIWRAGKVCITVPLFLLFLGLIFCSSKAFTPAQAETLIDEEKAGNAARQQYNQGKDYTDAGQYAQAQEVFRSVIETWPQERACGRALTQVAIMAIEDRGEAPVSGVVEAFYAEYGGMDWYCRAIYDVTRHYRRLDEPENVSVFYQENAGAIYQHIIDISPESKYAMRATKELAVTAVEAGDEQTAWYHCQNIIDNYLDYPEVARQFLLIGEAYYRKALSGDPGPVNGSEFYFARTIEICKYILEKVPELPKEKLVADTHLILACCYLYLSDFESALEHGQMLVDNYPDYEFTWRGQSIVGESYEGLKRLGAIPEAQADEQIKAVYQEIIRKYPGYPVAENAQEWLDLYNTKIIVKEN